MPSRKKPLAELLADLDDLASPANLRYGRAIHERGGVELIEAGEHRVSGWVGGLDGSVAEGGGQRRRARLSSTEAGLRWRCACAPKGQDAFCKHCAALALAVLDRSP